MATRTPTRFRLAEDFDTAIARAGLSKRELARRSGVSYGRSRCWRTRTSTPPQGREAPHYSLETRPDLRPGGRGERGNRLRTLLIVEEPIAEGAA